VAVLAAFALGVGVGVVAAMVARIARHVRDGKHPDRWQERVMQPRTPDYHLGVRDGMRAMGQQQSSEATAKEAARGFH
jgi:hypothetical protein